MKMTLKKWLSLLLCLVLCLSLLPQAVLAEETGNAINEPELTATITPVPDSDPAAAGTIITYTFTVKNTGNVELYNIAVTFEIINYTHTITQLGPGESWSDSASYLVNADDMQTGKVVETINAKAEPVIDSGTGITYYPTATASCETRVLPTVDYLDASGKECTLTRAYTVINSSNKPTTWDAGWYVVQGTADYTVNYLNGGITCSGEVHLILTDGCDLQVCGRPGEAGIDVNGVSNSLAIYGQANGCGNLTVNITGGGAGIGGGKNSDGSNITINGGNVSATSQQGGAGIGGGFGGNGSNITINGGQVTAIGVTAGSGIGGGRNGSGSNITINGGIIIATSNKDGAGIGGGFGGNGSNITINGGTVTATSDRLGAGIGGGASGNGSIITINGGCINATGSDGGEDIGSGKDGSAASGIVLKGGCYANNPNAAYVAACCEVVNNTDSGTSADYPYMVQVKAVNYIGADQTAKTLKEPYTIIDSTHKLTTWDAGWYVVKGTVDYPDGGITCSGDVHLILTDGCALSVKGGNNNAGICVSGGSNSLTIYGQTEGTGKLKAITAHADGGAGIGGGRNDSGSNITINGGTVTATGGRDSAGIGGGWNGNGSNITINGGTITTKGGNNGGTGIGGGQNGSGSNITINGGTVTATGIIGAGIGGGWNGNGSNITINGGTVTATGSQDGAGIGGGVDGNGSNITINGGYINATGEDGGAGIGGGKNGSGSNITINGGCINATGKYGGENIGSGTGSSAASGIVLEGGCYASKPDSKYIPSGYFIDDNTETSTKGSYPYAISQKTVCVYLDENGDSKSCADYTVINKYNMPTTWNAGWYVVQGTADYTEGGKKTNGITCSGAVHLILTDGCTLSVTGGNNKAGICVIGDANSLAIYGQSGGTGKLDASGVNGGAGIGGNMDQSGNNITINGGTVTATGCDGGAGIGGGNMQSGNNITINGGTVTATGGEYGAGIGGGFSGAGRNITINGGTVTSKGGVDGAGIGGGRIHNGSNITINGGTVKAVGGQHGAGIGGGYQGSGSNITINGGCIKATGSDGGENIGSGYSGGTASGIVLKGGCYTNKPDSKYIPIGYFADDNTDTATKTDYPYSIQQADSNLVLDGDYPGTLFADGEELEVVAFSGHNYLKIPDGAKVLTYYEYQKGAEAHTTYPLSMKVWRLSQDAGSGEWTATALTELDNLLTYCGTSIRTTGNRGVRVITEVDEALKKQLIDGLGGYTLSEYGTVMAWTEKLNGASLTLNNPNAVSNYAYSKANHKDPVFKRANGRLQYTNILMLSNMPDTAMGKDITMRPYMKLTDAGGSELVIYGGEVERSVGYVAYQNRNAFKPGTSQYEYIWSIIRLAYGTAYDREYISK